MTEEEARTKWCPFARAYDSDDIGGATSTNRPLQYERPRKDLNCIASGCMAWRWLAINGKRGYCGLAGKLS